MNQKLHDAIDNLRTTLEDVIADLDDKDESVSLGELEDSWNEFHDLAEKVAEKRGD